MKTKNETGNILVIGSVGYTTYYRIPRKSGVPKDQKGVED